MCEALFLFNKCFYLISFMSNVALDVGEYGLVVSHLNAARGAQSFLAVVHRPQAHRHRYATTTILTHSF